MLMLDKINKEIEDCPDTIFDTFKLTIDLRNSGASLRQDLVNLANDYGRINQLSTNALFKLEQARNKLEKVVSIAWAQYNEDVKITEKKLRIKNFEIEYPKGQTTSINKEEQTVGIYEYISQRGKDKVKEIGTILDVGRTLLSWDKAEQARPI